MKEISLTLTIDEANVILEALGNLAFVRVYALIGKIQEQARQQLSDTDAPANAGKTDNLSLTVKE